ncbi:MAG: hypothetical protein ACSHW1_14650 [Yoonia sp.]|uniref:hypothetical protein n=1 Tax=Yoonia sp. TaxID=2212373 RepID=UPI003EF262A6|tara:strand:- start:2919 stop:4463 length:1545 start_codon:yes stop_codon:yes gene_type:complete
MLDEFEMGLGFPQWTELGQDTGLDPLGMQRPIEVIYQSLLPGISTITLRLRYYSFYPWLLDVYSKSNPSTDLEEFRTFQRKAEALLALICAYGPGEVGVAGINWATRTLQSLGASPAADVVVDFAAGADLASDEENYLLNKGGAFGGIYSSQLREMGLIRTDDPNLPIPYCTSAALPLAEAYREQLGDLADVFLAAAKKGRVTIEQLDELQIMKPSNILPSSSEQSALATVLLGQNNSPSKSDGLRRETMTQLLLLAATVGRVPQTNDAKWAWFSAGSGDEPAAEILQLWSLYQASDLFRLAYEGLLSASLRIIEAAPFQRMTLPQVLSEVVDAAEISNDVTLEELFVAQIAGQSLDDFAQLALKDLLDAEATADSEDQVRASLSLLAALFQKRPEYPQDIWNSLLAADHFQSFATEARFIERLLQNPAQIALQEILGQRVIKRHLWVASRKFRNQKAYTFLFEPEDGALRYRKPFTISPSSPRIDQAVQFLKDARLLGDDGPTELGLREIRPQ